MNYLIDLNRLKNISWTVAENYDSDFNFRLFSEKNRYFAALRGYLYKFFDFELIEDFLKQFVYRLSNSEDLIAIAQIILENCIFNEILKDRPGVISFRDEYIKNYFKNISSLEIGLKKELRTSFYELKIGKVPKLNPLARELLNEMLSFNSLDSSIFINYLKYLFNKYFKINENLPPKRKKEYEEFEKTQKEHRIHRIKYKKDAELDDYELEKYTIHSAEFTSFTETDPKDLFGRELKASVNLNANIHDIIKKFYGAQNVPRHEVMNLQNKIAKGIHKDINLYFASYDYESTDSFYANRLRENYEDNINFYNRNFLVYERGIRKLSNTIKTYLLQDSEEYEIKSDMGTIVAKDIWRAKYLNDERIFKKVQKSDSPEIYVDILLDSSASQNERKSGVATECYIITSALTRLNIKTRVFGFNNLYNYLVIRKFRDYNDSEIKNHDIFEYTPSGSNRDGMAIKLMRYLIEENPDHRKFLIILSDGKPNDELHEGIARAYNLNVKKYTDKLAIKDSAKEILLTKLQGINTLGVFTGDEKDIPVVKNIYGNDFAYINDISRFHEIVGIFLKTFSNKLD
ncbi:MAG: hypothetical protein Q4P29_06810 [Tissierellia bacterium]|nr:hypothetical protein [Tissierellia bacterium]